MVAGEGRCRGRHGERPLVMVLPSCDGPVARDFDSMCSRVCSGASRRGISLAWMRLAGFQRDSFEGWWNEGAWSTPQPPSHLEFSHILAPLNFPLDVTAKTRWQEGEHGKWRQGGTSRERERESYLFTSKWRDKVGQPSSLPLTCWQTYTLPGSRARCRLPGAPACDHAAPESPHGTASWSCVLKGRRGVRGGTPWRAALFARRAERK